MSPGWGTFIFDFICVDCYISGYGEFYEKQNLEIYCNNCRGNFCRPIDQGDITVSDNGDGAVVWCGVGNCARAVFDDPGM